MVDVKKKKRTKIFLTSLLVIGLLAGATYSFLRIRQLKSVVASTSGVLGQKTEELSKLKSELVSNPSGTIARLQNEQVAGVLDEVSKLYSLPKDEQPTVATVQDKEKLKDQPFFEGAENGDQLIVYEKSGTAILYRPSEKKLVKVGPISIAPEQQSTSPTVTDPAATNP